VMLIWPALSVFESPFTGGLPALSTHLHPPFSDIRDGDFCVTVSNSHRLRKERVMAMNDFA